MEVRTLFEEKELYLPETGIDRLEYWSGMSAKIVVEARQNKLSTDFRWHLLRSVSRMLPVSLRLRKVRLGWHRWLRLMPSDMCEGGQVLLRV